MRRYRDYRDYLRAKGIRPLIIERTKKLSGDWVLVSSCLPVTRVP